MKPATSFDPMHNRVGPILLPIFWPIRWVDVLIHRRKNIRKKLQLVDQMSDEKLQRRERALSLMGVNFSCDDDEDE